MANNQFINLEELSKTTQALLSKINEQSNLKVNKANVSAEYSEGTKIAEIEDVEIYAPEIDTSNFITWDDDLDLAQVAHSGSYNDLSNTPTLATVATSGSYNDLNNKPTIPNVPSWALASSKPTYTASEVGAAKSSHTHTQIIYEVGEATSKVKVETSKATITVSNETPSGTLHTNTLEMSPLTTTIKNVVTPTNNGDAANKKYVDDGDTALSSRVTTLEEAGYITSYTETDPTVPSWAKQSTKPTYTATEVGALPSNTTFVSSFNGNTGAITYSAPVSSVNGDTGAVVVDQLKTTGSSNNTEYNLIGTATSNTNTTAVDVYKQDLLSFAKTTGLGRLTIGSTSIPGAIRIYTSADSASGFTDIKSNASSTNERTITLPDASGTVALTTDIPSVPSWALANNKPSYTFSELTTHPTTINGYGITDAYTKTEVDSLVSGVLHYKGTKANVNALPSSGNITGDVWHITTDGSEWAWDGSDWQELGTAIDLSGYLQSSDISAWAKAANKPSYTASEVGALPSSTTYVSSFNGQSGAITYIPPVSSVNGQTGVVSLSIPDVPSWALASSKPSYTASEVGALPSSTTYVSSFNGSTGAITYTAPVASVNGQTGAVSVTASSINAAADDHAHGSITNAGAITSNTAIASSDRLVFVDNSDSNKIKRSSITFGSSTSQYLANNGTWQNAYDDTALAARVTALEQIPWVTYYTGSTTPSNSQGNNGDLYFQTAQ